jgi:hypothetical protein
MAQLAAAQTGAGQNPTAPNAAGSTGTAPGASSSGSGGACLFAGPMLGTNLFSLHLSSSSAWDAVTRYLPGFRLGLDLPTGFIAGEAGLGLQGGISGYGELSLRVGATYGYDFFKLGPMQGYGLAGLNLGGAMQLGGFSTGGPRIVPTGQLSFGAGLEYSLTPTVKLATEGGLRFSMAIGSYGPEITTSAFVGLVGEYYLPGTTCNPGTTTTERPPPAGPTVAIAETPGEIHTTGGDTFHSSTATPCSTYPVDGWFEPSQGVWQDDLSFDDKATKQLSRAVGSGIVYQAELDMVQNKDSLLFGVHHYQYGNSGPVIVDSRDFIVLKGFSNCPVPKPVKFKFTLREGGSERTIYTSPVVATIPLEGAALPQYTPWEARLPVRNGVPMDGTFQFRQAGPYQLKAELQREDTGALTGLFMTVDGRTVQTMGPIVHFVPVLLSPATASEEGGLQLLTEGAARDSSLKVPDIFPLPPGGLPTQVKVIRNFTDLAIPDRWFEFRRISYTVAALNDSLASSVFLDGAGRIVAVMRGPDFRGIFGSGAAGMTVSESVRVQGPRGSSARTLSWKVMLMPSYESWDTVAHELVHTLPEGWADSEMQAECGKQYHNKKDPLAHGHKITEDSVPAATRERKVAMISYMGPSVSQAQIWTDQCTYWHLLKQMTGGPPDPPVTMVRAFVGKKGNKVVGELKPAYEIMGYADLNPGKGGPYAFVFKDAAGKELARFPFTPRYTDIETRDPLDIVSVVYRVPLVHDWATLELHGPGGVLDRKVRTASAPRVEITSPKDGETVAPQDGKVRLTWEGKGEGPLLYSVLYSADGGKTWTDQSFEQTAASADVILAKEPKGKDHRLKVVATDGTRSAEAVIKVVVAGP